MATRADQLNIKIGVEGAPQAAADLRSVGGSIAGAGVAAEKAAPKMATLADRVRSANVSLDAAQNVYGRVTRAVAAATAGLGAFWYGWAKVAQGIQDTGGPAAAQVDALDAAMGDAKATLTSLLQDAVEPTIPVAIELAEALGQVAKEAANSGSVAELAGWLVDVSYGAVLAARDLGRLTGVLKEGPAGADPVAAQAAVVEGLKEQLRLQREVDATGSDMSAALGVSIDGTTDRTRSLEAALEEALDTLRRLRGEASWFSGRDRGAPRRATGGARGPAARAGGALEAELPGEVEDLTAWQAGIEGSADDRINALAEQTLARERWAEQEADIARRAAAEQEQIEADSLDRRLGAIGSFSESAGTLFGAITDAVEHGSKRQTRAQVAALKAMFIAQKIAALASVAVNTAQGIMASFAQLGPIGGAVGAAEIGVAGGIAAGVIVGETVAGLVAGEGVGRRDKEPGHRTMPVWLRPDEAVLPPQATSDAYRLADAIGVAADRAERTSSGGQEIHNHIYLDGSEVSAEVERRMVRRIRTGHVDLARAIQGVPA